MKRIGHFSAGGPDNNAAVVVKLEEWCIDAENSVLITGMNNIWKNIHIEIGISY